MKIYHHQSGYIALTSWGNFTGLTRLEAISKAIEELKLLSGNLLML